MMARAVGPKLLRLDLVSVVMDESDESSVQSLSEDELEDDSLSSSSCSVPPRDDSERLVSVESIFWCGAWVGGWVGWLAWLGWWVGWLGGLVGGLFV